jgi:hypothetical protein
VPFESFYILLLNRNHDSPFFWVLYAGVCSFFPRSKFKISAEVGDFLIHCGFRHAAFRPALVSSLQRVASRSSAPADQKSFGCRLIFYLQVVLPLRRKRILRRVSMSSSSSWWRRCGEHIESSGFVPGSEMLGSSLKMQYWKRRTTLRSCFILGVLLAKFLDRIVISLFF